jgi:hypothetical protein
MDHFTGNYIDLGAVNAFLSKSSGVPVDTESRSMEWDREGMLEQFERGLLERGLSSEQENQIRLECEEKNKPKPKPKPKPKREDMRLGSMEWDREGMLEQFEQRQLKRLEQSLLELRREHEHGQEQEQRGFF